MNLPGAVQVPKSGRAARRLRSKLTVQVFDVVADVSKGESRLTPFHAYFETEDSIWIPRDYARKTGLDVEYAAGCTLPRGTLNPVKLREKKQQPQWVDEIVSLFNSGVHDIRAEAHTGAGKTVMSLEIARRLGKNVLIVVDQDFLRDQWAQRAVELFGADEDDIGYIQGKSFEFTKPIVIAMVQTLYRKTLPEIATKRFGTVIFDESHGIGAPIYSKVLSMLPAAHRLAVSATPDRGDALDEVLKWHLGPVQVVLAQTHRASVVRVVEYEGVYSWYANTSPKTGRYLQEITADGDRSRLLARMIHNLWNSGRTVLAVSDRTEHLETLIALCGLLGVPEEEMGLVCGTKTVWKLAKDDNPTRKPRGYVKGTLYTPLRMQLVRKRIPKKALESAKDESRIIFATYGMFRKGVDVPRLDAGVDCTPSSKAKQVHGRILRSEVSGKKVPIWATLREWNSQRAEYQLSQRLVDYQESNAEVYLWKLDKGVARQDIVEFKRKVRRNNQWLKEQKIVTKRDGNYTILTQE